jgi:hypothetical protein
MLTVLITTVAAQVFQVADQHELKEYYRVNTLLAFGAIIFFCRLVEIEGLILLLTAGKLSGGTRSLN